jgi:DNA-binding NarL/FixJ family response regulator
MSCGVEAGARGPTASQPDDPARGSSRSARRVRRRVRLGAAGLWNDEIAEQLFLSPLTAKTHVNRAMTKLGARDRAQLVVMAYQSGLSQPL